MSGDRACVGPETIEIDGIVWKVEEITVNGIFNNQIDNVQRFNFRLIVEREIEPS